MLDLILRQRKLVRLCIYDSMPPAWSTGAYTDLMRIILDAGQREELKLVVLGSFLIAFVSETFHSFPEILTI